jgi:signal transduction histidine kinase
VNEDLAVNIPQQKRRISKSGFPKSTAFSVALVVLLCAILIALAVLQYRWSGQVSEAEHERLQTSLLTAMNQLRVHFQNEFQRLGMLFQPDPVILNQQDWDSFAVSCDTLLSESESHLVRNVWLWLAGTNGSSQLLRLNRATKKFGAESWPSDFESIRARYTSFFSEPLQPGRALRPFDRFIRFEIPLMIHPLTKYQPASGRPNQQLVGFLLLQLNRDNISKELIPELAEKYFGGPDGFIYHIAVVSGRNHADLLYSSDAGLTAASFAYPDARMNLFENPRERFGPGGPGPERAGPPPPAPPMRPEPPGRGRRPGMPPLLEQDGTVVEVLAKHREGSLDAAIAGSRRRNLALSFGSLLLLAVSMSLILVFARRAHRLAQLQIDFVAGVSHELRTPLAVICSAGDNLADGVVGNADGSARKYGELIRSEGRRLAAMIEQILKFASLRSGRYLYNLSPAHINDVVLNALEQSKSAIEASGFSVDTSFDPDLPPVNVDSTVLSKAIQNLIQNALKYSGESRWMQLRTEKAQTKRGIEVCLTVEDRGLGIDREDLGHIFEPFYRGGAALAAQIHGTGLGLFMVQEAVTSMGGRVAFKSARGKGSIFTIHLPGSQLLNSQSTTAGKESPNDAAQNTID